MGVMDRTTLALKSVVMVNSDVAASQQVADRYCAMYGIPRANQFVYAMGSDVVWAYDSGRYAGFWTDLLAHVTSIGAYAIFSTAGCPTGIYLRNIADDGNVPVNFALLLGVVKRFMAYGYEPKGVLSSGDAYPADLSSISFYDSVANHKGEQTQWDSALIASALETALDSEHTDAGGLTGSEYQFTSYRTGWSGNFAAMGNLLTGHIGYYSSNDASHSASLWDLSRVILGKAGNLQRPLSAQTSVVALVCPQWIGGTSPGTYSAESKQALVGKRMVDAGLDVKHWYVNSTTAAANALLPTSGEYPWTVGELDSNTTATDCTYTYAVGCGFANGSHDTWDESMIPSDNGGIFCGGQSYGNRWGKHVQRLKGFSYVAHMGTDEYNDHQGEKQQSKICDIWLALLAGKTLAESAWLSREFSFLAVGDPLMRPFPS